MYLSIKTLLAVEWKVLILAMQAVECQLVKSLGMSMKVTVSNPLIIFRSFQSFNIPTGQPPGYLTFEDWLVEISTFFQTDWHMIFDYYKYIIILSCHICCISIKIYQYRFWVRRWLQFQQFAAPYNKFQVCHQTEYWWP